MAEIGLICCFSWGFFKNKQNKKATLVSAWMAISKKNGGFVFVFVFLFLGFCFLLFKKTGVVLL